MAEDSKITKRFNNGHKTFTYQEQEFLKETYTRERSSFEKFVEKAPTMRRARNPCLGELTPRAGQPTTELWMPEATLLKPPAPTYVPGSASTTTFEDTTDNMAEALRKRKEKIQNELSNLNRSIDFKKDFLSKTQTAGHR